jgi:hypothetical protein
LSLDPRIAKFKLDEKAAKEAKMKEKQEMARKTEEMAKQVSELCVLYPDGGSTLCHIGC